MTFLPIVGRELRVASRRRGAYWGRFGAAAAAMGIGAWIMLVTSAQNEELGRALFVSLSVLSFFYAAAGARLTCDCLSAEKREGTLGLLFLTDLRGYDVVFGKLAATSLNAFYGLLAVVPVLAIPLLLGAVGLDEFCRVALVSLNLLFFSLSLGIFVSSVCRQDQRAFLLAALLMLALVVGLPLLVSYFARRILHHGVDAIGALSPAYDCFTAFSNANIRGPMSKANRVLFWSCAGGTQIYSWLFLLLACRVIPRSWQDKSSVARRPGWRGRWDGLLGGDAIRRAAERKELLETNPYLWRVARGPFQRAIVWAVLIGLVGLWWWARKPLSTGFWDPGMDIACMVILHTFLKLWLASEACRHFSEDRRAGCMELLLSTLLTETDIIRGQFLGLWRKFGWPVVAVLLLDLSFLAVALRHPGSSEDFHASIGVYAIAAAFLVMDLIALSWVGMWLGLSGRKPNRGMFMSFSAIVLLPSLAFYVTVPFFAMGLGPGLSIGGLLTYWCVLGLAADALCITHCQHKLKTRFRETVSGALRGPRKPAVEIPAPRVLAIYRIDAPQ